MTSTIAIDADFWNGVVSIVIFEFIYLPLAVYYTRRYRKHRHHTVLKARRGNVALWEAYIAITKFLYGPFESVAFYLWGGASVITRSITAAGGYLAYFLFHFMVWRIWLLFYDLKWTIIIMDNEWKLIIDPMHRNTASDDWFITHKATWGNLQWMKWKVVLIAFISGSIFNAFGLFGSYHHDIFYQLFVYGSLPLLIPCMVMIYIYHQLRGYKFEDHFFIRQEMRYIFIVFCIQYSGFYAVNIFMAFEHSLDENTRTLLTLVSFQCVMLAQFMALMISTCWILRKVQSLVHSLQFLQF